MISAFQAILFDLDGVIVNSEPLHVQVFRLTLREHGHELSDSDYAAHFAGRTDAEGFEQYFRFVQEQPNISLLMNDKAQRYLELAADQLVPYNGVTALIHGLAQKFSLALVTGSLRTEAHIALDACGVLDCFKNIIAAEDVINGKPDPVGYLLAAQKLSIDPQNCLVIEDSPSGIAAANAAGMQSIAVTSTHSADELRNATLIVDQLEPSCFNGGS